MVSWMRVMRVCGAFYFTGGFMAQYDGSIRIDTKIDSKQASVQLMTLENRIIKTSDKIASLRSKMDALGSTQIPTQQYKEIESDISKAENELQKLIEKQAQMKAEGKDSGTVWDRLNQRIQASKDYIELAQEEMQELVDTGKAFAFGRDAEEFARLGQQLQYAENDMAILNRRHDELIAKQGKASDGYKKLGKAARQSFDKINKSAKKTGGFLSAMASRFKGLALSLLIFNQISKAFNSMTSGIKQGFDNFYQGNEKFRNSVDNLKTSLLTLKNSFAAAFAPLVQMVIPYIQKAVEWLTALINKIGQFIAAVSGQKTYTKAIKQTAAAIKEQNKAQSRQLSSLDKLNNLTSDKGADDGGAEGMFEEVPIDKSVLDFLQNIKDFLKPVIDYAQKLKDIFMQGFWDGLGDWEYRWEDIKENLQTIKDVILRIITDSEVLKAVGESIESVIRTIGTVIGSIASIVLTIIDAVTGGIAKFLEQNEEKIKEFIVSISNIVTEISNLISKVAIAIAYVFEAFSSEQGQQLIANILGIIFAVSGVVEFVYKLFRDLLNIVILPFIENADKLKTSLEGLLSFFEQVTGTIKDGLDETFDKLNEVYDEHFKPFFDSIATGLSDTVGKFLEFWNGSVQPILDEWAAKFDEVWQAHIQPMLNKFVALLGKVADFLKVLWENILKPLIDWVIENVLPVMLPIIDGIGKAFMTLFGTISDIVSGIIDIFSGIIDFLIGVFTGDWDKAWSGIVDTFKGIFNLIPTIIEGILNTAIGVINGLIGGINKISGTVGIPAIPDIPEVSIPRLATGTVVPPNREFLAVLGDNKREPEVVSPISTIEQAVENAMRKNGGMGSGEITIKIPVEIDGNVLFELIKKLDMQQFNRTGRPSFQI